MALQGLVECILDICTVVERLDRTITLPYPIQTTDSSGATTTTSVGGCSVLYETNKAVEWTRAMKYLLTDLKHLLTYKGWSVWMDC